MNPPVKSLIEAMQRTLRDDVLPEVTTDYARCQVFGVLDILAQLAQLAVWSPHLLNEQAVALRRGIAALEALGAPASSRNSVKPATGPVTDADRDSAIAPSERRLNELIAWRFTQGNGMDEAKRRAVDGLLRETIREALVIERNLLPRVDFAAMSGGKAKTADRDG